MGKSDCINVNIVDVICYYWKKFEKMHSRSLGFLGGSVVKNLPANAGDLRHDSLMIPGLGRFHEEGNGNPLQYSCLGNRMGRGTWRTTVHGVTKSWTTTEQLNNNNAGFFFLFCFPFIDCPGLIDRL